MESSLTLVLVALAVVLLTAYFFLRSDSVGGGSAGIVGTAPARKVHGVVLAGCSGSGKTIMLHQLVSGVVPETIPSMVPGEGSVALPSGKKITVIDHPGHERLRPSMIAHLVGCKGAVVVVDPTSTKTIKQAALLLFQLLSAEELSTKMPLLVFCNNKADVKGQQPQPPVRGAERVKVLLAREIEAMRKAQGALTDTGGGRRSRLMGSQLGDTKGGGGAAAFAFDTHTTFASGSALGSAAQTEREGGTAKESEAGTAAAAGLGAVVSFLEKCA